MKFFANFKYYGLLCCLLSSAFASEGEKLNDAFDYAAKDYTVQHYASKEEWKQDVQEFLNDKKRIKNYKTFQDGYKEKYKINQEKQWEADKQERERAFDNKNDNIFFWTHLAGVTSAGASALIATFAAKASLPVIFASIFASGLSPYMAFGIFCLVRKCQYTDPLLPIFAECPRETLQDALMDRIKNELVESKYLTGSKKFPVESGKNLLDGFVAKICGSNDLASSTPQYKI